MISAFRSYLNTWVVRVLFLVLVVAFAMWGVGDVLRMVGTETWVAKVGDVSIEPPEAQQAFQRQLAQVTQMFGGKIEPTPEIRRSVALQTIDRLVAQALLTQEERDLRIAASDDALREAVFAVPAFRGANGQFDRARFEQLLRSNGLTEARFLDLMRTDLKQRQLTEAVRAGATPPEVLTRAVFDFQNEKRAADMVDFPFAAAKPPADPGEDVLRRWWENHPNAYRTPEYRKVKVVVLSPQTLAKDIQVSEDELRSAYDAHKADFVTPARRSAQVIAVPDEAKAKALAADWRGGTDWSKMQQDAQAAGGTGIELNDASQAEFPSPELGQAVFAAAPDQVSDPIHGALGWNVVRVTKVMPGTERSFEQVKDELRDRLIAEKAADLMYERANKVDNLLGGGTALDQLPGDLGLGAVTGTLDAKGDTPAGGPAPIPGPAELRDAVVGAAFQAQKGDPPRLTEVPTPSVGGSSYYALEVDDITPAAQKPFESVKDQVRADWTRDAVHKEAEETAAQMLSAVKAGAPFAEAAAKAGVSVRRSPATTRAEPAEGFPRELVQPLFATRQGEATMVETPDGFIVATPATIETPDPKTDPIRYNQAKEGLARALGNDIEVSFVQGLRERIQPRVNQKMLDSIAQP